MDYKRELLARLLERRRSGSDDEVAVIGLAGRYPHAPTPAALWARLERGESSITEIPSERWDWRQYSDAAPEAPAPIYSRWGGFLEEIDRFDPLLFRLSPREAEVMDPQERLFLETVWCLIEDAGYTRRTLAPSAKVGVFVGVMNACYGALAVQSFDRGEEVKAFSDFHAVANRVSYCFDFRGPSIAVDTACSSSLTAVHLACQSLRLGESEVAIAGGVNLILHPLHYARLCSLRMLASGDQCRAFGDGADGFVAGEGVGAVLLKPLRKAEADGDRIYAIIKASAANAGGRTSGYTVPNPAAQADLIAEAVGRAAVEPRTIGYVEAHGTGTSLGDPIEVAGLSAAFGRRTREKGFCAIGSVKSNLGHLEAAAGIAGLTKVLLQLKHRRLAPSINADRLNPKIDFEGSPFYLVREPREWSPLTEEVGGETKTLPLRAALSSFGAGGANVHLVVEEHTPLARTDAPAAFESQLVLLSAKDAERLREVCARLLEFVRARQGDLSSASSARAFLSSLAFTLQAGREQLEQRVALVVSEVGELRRGLEALTGENEGGPVIFRGRAQTGGGGAPVASLASLWLDATTEPARDEELRRVARGWVAGGEIEGGWPCGRPKPALLDLPHYPFARERYWGAPPPAVPANRKGLLRHPMLTRADASGDAETTARDYRVNVPADHVLAREHEVAGRPALPGVASIEMALAAVADAHPEVGFVEFRNVRWLQPVFVGETRELRLSIFQDAAGHGFKLQEPGGASTFAEGRWTPGRPADANAPEAFETIKERCAREVDCGLLYQQFARAGVSYGNSFRGLRRLWLGEGEALAELDARAAAHGSGAFTLSPFALDAALQAAAPLVAGATQGEGKLLVPFSVARVLLPASGFEFRFAYVRATSASSCDITILDGDGRARAMFQGVAFRPWGTAREGFLYTPVWSPHGEPASDSGEETGPLLIVGSPETESLAGEIRARQSARRTVFISFGRRPDADDDAAPATLLEELKRTEFAEVYYLCPVSFGAGEGVAWAERETESALRLLKLLQALQAAGYGGRRLSLKIFGVEVYQALCAGDAAFSGATSFGLALTAAKESPKWEVACLDFETAFLTSEPERAAALACALKARRGGIEFAVRGRIAFTRSIVPLKLPHPEESPYRRGGVYLLVGGAGGVGFAVSRHLAATHAARVAWVGRRPVDDEIRRKLEEVESLGGEAMYVQADAADVEAMRAAVGQVRARFGAVNGAFRSALVLRDATIPNLDEEDFREALRPKVGGAVALYEALREESLDFLVFFSSSNSFVCGPGQSNYAAANIFEDAYALWLRRRARCAVKVINWGYWGDAGAVADEVNARRLAALGVLPLAADEGVGALARCLGSTVGQVIAVRLADAAGGGLIDVATRVEPSGVSVAPLGRAAVEASEREIDAEAFAGYRRKAEMLTRVGRLLLLDAFRRAGVFRTSGERWRPNELRAKLGVTQSHERLFDCLLDILREAGFVNARGNAFETTGAVEGREARDFLSDPRARLRKMEAATPEAAAHLRILARCLQSYPEILAGRVRATEVLFPDGGAADVQAIYRDSVVAAHMNESAARIVRAYVAARLRREPGAEVVILEVGAGTGGTTASVLAALGEFGARVRYVYTDVSHTFLEIGRRQFGRDYPFVSYRVFDMETDGAGQGLDDASFDLVLAANVTHASRRVEEVLARFKALLKRGGSLLLNEGTEAAEFVTLTFGLTAGWWLFEDEEVRIPGSPLLAPETWGAMLTAAGFLDVRTLGARNLSPHELGNALVVGTSDGDVRRRVAPARRAEAASVDEAGRPERVAPAAAHTLADKRQADARSSVEAYLSRVLGGVLKIEPSRIDPEATFDNYGVDSLVVLEVNERLESYFGELPASLLFEHNTLRSLAGYFVAEKGERLAGLSANDDDGRAAARDNDTVEVADVPARESAASAPAAHPGAADERPRPAPTRQTYSPGDIAVVGMAGKYPLADDLFEFWDNLAAGRDCVREIPRDRWDWREFDAGEGRRAGLTAYSRWAGLIDGAGDFDASFFSISPKEAARMDPQERLFLQNAWATLEDAGYTRAALAAAGGEVGVFVGVMNSQYELHAAQALESGETCEALSSLWSIPNRVSYFFDLQGPSVAVDTACSSSLTAIHLACESLRRGECRLALAGGVNLILHPLHYLRMCAMNMLSRGPQCRSFGAGADGFVDGEGVGSLLLKPLADALADGDRVHGVIRGSSLNAGGKTSGFTVPNPNAQAKLIHRALTSAGVDPRTVGYVEAHGTGTALGDPIEMAGLTKAFRSFTEERGFCALGSVKSQVGHLESAAGVVGLTKVLLMLKRRALVPTIHSEPPHPKIDFAASPFYLQREPAPWEPPAVEGVRAPRRAGVSSFGAGGANAHVIVEEFEEAPRTSDDARGPQVVPLSARDDERLRAYAEKLVAYLDRQAAGDGECAAELADIAYTLQVGREPMAARFVTVARTNAELRERLASFLAGETAPQFWHRSGETGAGTESLLADAQDAQLLVERWAAAGKWERVAQLWATGGVFDWRGLPRGARGRIVSLPTYPFAPERHWFKRRSTTPRRADALHALIDRNTSTFDGQSFAKEFAADSTLLSHHLVRERPTLPGAACAEMMRVAAEFSTGRAARRIEQLRWLRPLTASAEGLAVRLRLTREGSAVAVEVGRGDGDDFKAHALGRVTFEHAPHEALHDDLHHDAPPTGAEELRAAGRRVRSGEECYGRFRESGLEHGAAMRVIEWMATEPARAVARLRLPDEVLAGDADFVLHPALLDGAMLTTAALVEEAGLSPDLFLPHSLGGISWTAALSSPCFAVVTWAGGERDGDTLRFNVRITDEAGSTLARLEELTLQRPAQHASADLLFYAPAWHDAPAATLSDEAFTGRVVLFDEGEELYALLAREWGGERVTLVTPGDRYVCEGDRRAVRFAEEQDYEALFDGLEGAEELRVVFRWTRPASAEVAADIDPLLARDFYPAALAARALIRTKRFDRIRFIYVCPAGAQAAPHQLAFAEFGKCVALEDPRLSFRTLLPGAELSAADEMARALKAEWREMKRGSDAVRLERGRREVRAWDEVHLEDTPAAPLKTRGVYLITGANGGLGRAFARHLARGWQARLALCGRTPPDADGLAFLEELRAAGAEAEWYTLDATDRNAVADAVRDVKLRHGELNGVIHSALCLRDGLLREKPLSDVAAVIAPKVHGALVLDEVTRDESLDFFALFSSFVVVRGNPGQSDYAFANSFTDHFAAEREHRRAAGRRTGVTVAFQWPAWDVGGASLNSATRARLTQAGLSPLKPEDGVRVFESGLGRGEPFCLVVSGDARRIRQSWEAEMSDAKTARPSSPAAVEDQHAVRARAERILVEALAAETQLPAARVKLDEPFDHYGLDSLMVMNLTTKLEESFGPLPKTLFFEHQTIAALSEHLAAHYGDAPALAAPVVETRVVTEEAVGAPTVITTTPRRDEVRRGEESGFAVVGMAGRYPGADTLEEFWRVLREGRDCIREIPRERWDGEALYHPTPGTLGKTPTKWGGFLDDIAGFDSAFFRMTPREAEAIDPQERLFLQTVWHALEDAGNTRAQLSALTVGVFVGVMYSEYQLMTAGFTGSGGTVTGSSPASVANRASYFFDFRGPSLAIDTMCSSSLTALHLALESIRRGECDAAVAGGVNLTPHPHKYLMIGQGGFAATDGRCRSFGRGGNGYVPAEGVGAVLIKPLALALEAGDRIHAVIKASALNHGGRSTGYTVPNPRAQGAVIRRALDAAGWSPSQVGYVEAHGTGTALGDPVEVAGLTRAFADGGATERRCPIGSVKSNIGHAESAAGIAGLTKIILQLKHQTLVPSLHSAELNPNIDFERSPFRVQQTLEAWPRLRSNDGGEEPLRAGLSSFGAGGGNAHILVEEWRDERESRPSAGKQLFLLSARDSERLREYARRWADFAEAQPAAPEHEPSLSDAAFTLQVGREHMGARLAAVVGGWEELAARLRAWSDGVETPGAVRAQDSTPLDEVSQEKAEELYAARRLDELAALWERGLDVSWEKVRRHDAGGRVSLPLYPFAAEQHWVSFESEALAAVTRHFNGKSAGATAPPSPANGKDAEGAHAPGQTTTTRHAGAGDGGAAERNYYVESFWKPSPLGVEAGRDSEGGGGALLVLAADDSWREVFGSLIQSAGGESSRFVVLRAGRVYEKTEHGYTVDPGSVEDFRRVFAELERENRLPERAVFFAPRGGADESPDVISRRVRDGLHPLLLLTQAHMSLRLARRLRLLYVYAEPDAANAAVGGFVRTLREENPFYIYKAVCVDGLSAADAATRLRLEFAADDFPEVKLTPGGRHVRHGRNYEPNGALTPSPLKERGVYLITGGAKGIGLLFADHLARKYRARLVLVGRSELSADARAEFGEWQSLGAEVVYLRGDVSRDEDARWLLAAARERFGRIDGIIHSAAVLNDGFILTKRLADFDAVLAPKVYGTVALDRASADDALDFFVCFSSVAGALGNVGQSDYAFANAFMDRFVEARERRRRAGERRGISLSINWPLWQQGGMQTSKGVAVRSGLRSLPLPVADGVAAFEFLLRSGHSQMSVLYGDAEFVGNIYKDLGLEVCSEEDDMSDETNGRGAEEMTTTAADDDFEKRALKHLAALIAGPTKMDPARMDADAKFADLGLDSVIVLHIIGELEEALGALPKTLFLEYETLRELTSYLTEHHRPAVLRMLAGQTTGEAEAERTQSQAEAPQSRQESNGHGAPQTMDDGGDAPRADNVPVSPAPRVGAGTRGDEVAIVGIAGRYPGARDLEEFWELLRRGETAVGEVPRARWDADALYDPRVESALDGKIYCKWGAFIDGADEFDPLFFHMNPAEAELTNPEDRLALETVWAALEDGGIRPASLAERPVGVFFGMTTNTYPMQGVAEGEVCRDLWLDGALYRLANRVSYSFDFTGPSLTLDTACSSSLVALDMACRSIQSGESEAAIVGGVNLYLHPSKYLGMCRGRLLARGPRPSLFAAGGDGFIPGEGVGVVVLKPLGAALRDGNHVHAVVKGVAVNHKGKGSGLLLPSVRAQASVIESALARGGVRPETVSFVEAQVLGSEMADAAEWKALRQVYGRAGGDRRVALSSLKPNIGHLEAASGLAQLTKVVLQMRHRRLASASLADEVNPEVDLHRSAFFVPGETTAWTPAVEHDAETPLRAAVNSYGAGGTQAHVILESWEEARTPRPRGEAELVLLSNRRAEGLREQVSRLRDYLTRPGVSDAESFSLSDVAYTLQVGREAFEHRAAFIASGAAELVGRLNSFLEGRGDPRSVFVGDATSGSPSPGAENVGLALSRGDLTALAEAWACGAQVEWSRLARRAAPRLVPLPTYVFRRQRCWRETVVTPRPTHEDAAALEVSVASAEPASVEGVVSRYYNRTRGDSASADARIEEFLNFAPFPEVVPGFSWLRLFADPAGHAREFEYTLARQREMRRVLFNAVDFDSVRDVLDIGCGMASDLISLCRAHAELRGDGFTLAARQAAEARRRVEASGLQGRVRVFEGDSARDSFAGLYDLVIGFEVTFHIEDKPSLFANIARHTRPGARLVLADVVADTTADVNMPALGQFTCTGVHFAERLADAGFRLSQVCDASAEVANFLDDPRFEENLAELSARHPAMKAAEQEHRGWFRFGQALRSGLFRYLLLTAERTEGADVEELRRHNREVIGHAKPYAEALRETAAAVEGSGLTQSSVQRPAASVVGVAPSAVGEVRRILTSVVSGTLRMSPDDINPRASFADYGVNSLQALQVIDRVNREFELELQVQHFFDHSSIEDLSRFIADQYRPEVARRLARDEGGHAGDIAAAAKEEPPPPSTTERPADTREAVDVRAGVAVIGMAGRFPRAADVEQFWENVRDGLDCVTEFPAERLSLLGGDNGADVRQRWGGYLSDVQSFDPLFFGISPTEAKFIDPQHRLFLEACWHALEDAGHAGGRLSRSKCGVFVGALGGEYQNVIARAAGDELQGTAAAQAMLGNSASILASRIAYFLNLKGAATTVDTACSSSLVAVHLACRSLLDGETNLMLAGGVSLYLTEQPYRMMSGAGMLSPTGRCRPFDDKADGIVPGEAAAVVVLKRFEDALRDGDHIYGVIRASGINQDGRTNGITAPSSESQKELELSVYRRGRIDPAHITLVEAHGTGTPLGDPIEVAALAGAFREFTARERFCAIGSVKSNLGHTSAAAGVVGLIKVLLAIKHRQIPPTLHVAGENHHIDFAGSPFYVSTTLRPWEPAGGLARVAAVSSFGFSGTNCHLVVEEHVEGDARPPRVAGPCVVTLSARTEEQLCHSVALLLAHLAKLHARDELPELDDLAFTLQAGRMELPERLATVVDDVPTLIARLAKFVRGGVVSEILTGSVKGPGEASDADTRAYAPDRDGCVSAARLWVKGGAVSWESFYTGRRPRRVSLPTYPFERRRCWVSAASSAKQTSPATIAPARRPQQVNGTNGGGVKAAPAVDDFFSAPRWVPAPLQTAVAKSENGHASPRGLVLVVQPEDGADWRAAAKAEHAGREVVAVLLGGRNSEHADGTLEVDASDPEAFRWLFSTLARGGAGLDIDTLYFMAGVEGSEAFGRSLGSYERCWERGTVNLLRLIKAAIDARLLDARSPSAIRHVRLATNHAHAVADDDMAARPHFAGLHGMAKTLASEYPQLHVACLDLDVDDAAQAGAGELREALAALRREPAIRSGREVAVRAGRRYERVLFSVAPDSSTPSLFKRGGVYVIAGGASGIGLALSRHLAAEFDARLVLVGRRPPEGEVRRKLDELEALGGAVEYVSADITRPGAMATVVNAAKARFGRIDGAIQSALVVNRQSFAEMDEAGFRAVAAPKTAGSVLFYEALAGEPLDFVAFFSSGQSFANLEKRAHYAAGCAFKDAFARALRTGYPVRVFNWGFWDVNEIAEESRQRMTAQGVYFMDDAEGVAAIKSVLAGPEPQVMILKAEPHAREAFGIRDAEPASGDSFFDRALPAPEPPALGDRIERLQEAGRQLDDFSRLLLAGAFRSLGLARAGERVGREELRRRCGLLDTYRRLFDALLDMLSAGGYVRLSGDSVEATARMEEAAALLEQAEERRDAIVASYPEVGPNVRLVWDCLANLLPVLRGEASAQEVMFSGASNTLLESIYRGNPVADYFNDCVTRVLARYVQCRLEANGRGEKKIKVLEVGAGTGGTTAGLLERLAAYAEHVEYCYTDLSLGFTRLGRRKFQASYPFADYRVLDIEKPVAAQGFDEGGFDVVIAANVLHATRDIRAVLRHVGSLLRPGGWLVLYEGVCNQEFMTPTFGLLEGWWRYTDPELRLKNSPLLDLETWVRLLGEEGFARTKAYGPEVAGDAGPIQAVIVAERDGAAAVALAAASTVAPHTHAATPSNGNGSNGNGSVPRAAQTNGDVEARVVACIVGALELSEGDFDPDQSFIDLGVDSILAIDLVNQLNAAFDIRLRPTDMYSLTTPRALCAHVSKVVAGEPAESATGAGAEVGGAGGDDDDDALTLDLLQRVGAGELQADQLSRQLHTERTTE